MARSGQTGLAKLNRQADLGQTPFSPTKQPAHAKRFVTTLMRCMVWAMWAVVLGTSVLGTSVLGSSGVLARRQDSGNEVAREPAVALSGLPAQAQEVHRRILSGGPFRYDKDGSVFGNRERILPREPRGFYREYTVPTPGERDRGARRIVCGGKDTRQPETCFYTKDHYQSFHPIDPRR